MPVTTVADMLASLRSHRLLEPPQLAKLTELQAKIPDSQTLAKQLIGHGWLTPYQVNQIFQGKSAELRLGSYVLLERLGEGGMGEVFKAKNWKMGRIVALKIIRKDRLQNDNAVRRFQREVKASAQLAHPNIVAAIDADMVGQTLFYAMEYVEGTDLAKQVREHGPLPVDQACEIMRQAACGLAHAHEKGLVHRDIKPSNILVTPIQGQVKILDMGLARTADADETSTLTQEGSILGTLDYLSPEQALNANKADIRSDLYSLGCTFYFLLTGQVPFPGGTATEKLLRHRLEDPEPLEKLRPDVPPSVAGMIRKLMARQPEDRYQTPAELVAALAGGRGKIPAGKKPGLPPPGRIDLSPTVAGEGPDTTKTGGSAATAAFKRKGFRIALGIGGLTLALLGLCLIGSLLAPKASTETAGKQAANSAVGKTITAEPRYVKMPTREETLLATLRACGYPTLEGKWHYIGYFDVGIGKGFETKYPPESEIDLKKSYPGKGGHLSWKEFKNFAIGTKVNLNNLAPDRPFANLGACVYLLHELETAEPLDLPIGIGGDDAVTLWINGKQQFSHNAWGPFAPEQHLAALALKAGKNQLLFKVCNTVGDFFIQLVPRWPAKLESLFGDHLKRDFPK